jgi:hypothetical protein
MPSLKKQPPMQIVNTVCPVCGGAIRSTSPLVELSSGRKHELSLLVHVCGDACRLAARADEERYVAAARDNRRG